MVKFNVLSPSREGARFESVESLQQAMGRHAREILADIPNYTDTQPVVWLSEVVVDRG